MKRLGESQDSNCESVAPFERDFWNDLPKVQIVLKSSDGPLSKYMRVENSEIVLNDYVMLNSQDGLIVDVFGISTQGILIKKSYLEIIENIESDHINHDKKACTIIGSPDDDSLEKLIHIIPSAEEYVHASKEIYRALFRYYKNNTKDKIINIIRSFSGGNFKVRRLADKTSKYPKETLDLKSLDLNQYDDVQEINTG
ncbi:9595_t:CDS:2, partial [Rhizophagus irregularis]